MSDHKHYSGFTMGEESLKAHLTVDHSMTDEQIESLKNPEKWHADQHEEISGSA